VHAVEHKDWPVGRNFSAYAPGSDDSHLMEDANRSETSEVITITTDHGSRGSLPSSKRKRHIAIDVETERGGYYCLSMPKSYFSI
jgi:hypothetical protein